MMRSTHTVAGACLWVSGASFAPHSAAFFAQLAGGAWIAGLAGNAPDLDLLLGQWAHRKATHSAIGLGMFFGTVALIVGSVHGPGVVVLAAVVGYLSHLITDALTVHGIPVFWPTPTCYHLLPEGRRISTGGKRRKHPRWWQRKRGAPYGEVIVSSASIALAMGCLIASHALALPVYVGGAG